MDKLAKKCRLTEEEFDVAGGCGRNFYPILTAQLTKAIPIIRADEREQVFKQVERYIAEVLSHNPAKLKIWQSIKKGEA